MSRGGVSRAVLWLLGLTSIWLIAQKTLPSVENAAVTFVDATEQARLQFRHVNAATSNKYLIEAMGGGVALLDYDNDGWLDIFFVNGAALNIPASSGKVTVRVDVRNSGTRAGDEVVQLYVHDVEAKVKRPAKELRGFERIHLKPAERRTVTFSLPGEKLAFYNVSKHAFTTEAGKFEVLVGASSDDIRLKREFQVTSAGQWLQ